MMRIWRWSWKEANVKEPPSLYTHKHQLWQGTLPLVRIELQGCWRDKQKEERELEEARKNAPVPDPADEDEEEERWMESDLAKRAQQKKLEEQKQQWEKAKTFSKDNE